MSTAQTRHNPGLGMENPLRKLTAKKKIALILVFIIIIAVSVLLIQFVRASGYRLLYADLSHRDMAQITAWLDARNIGFRIKNYGRDIYIGADRVYQTRLDLSRELVTGPAGSLKVSTEAGFDRLLSGPASTSNADLQYELARTIASLDAIDSARVLITAGDISAVDSPLSGPHASIFLKPIPGKTLSNDNLTSVTNLVSQAVAGLRPDNIVIYDSYGRTLASGNREIANTAVSSQMLHYQQFVENRLERRAKEVVDALLGAGHALIRVAVTLDNSQSEATSEHYDPNRTTVKKEHTEYAPGSSYTAAEQTDQIQYIPPIPTTSSIDYEVNRTVKKTVKPAGTIEKITVSLLVTGKPEIDDDGRISYVDRSEEELDSLESAVSRVLSLQPDRGDTVTIIPIPSPTIKREITSPERVQSVPYELLVPLVKLILMIVGFGLLYLLIIKPILDILAEGDTIKEQDELSIELEAADETVQSDQDKDFADVLKDEILRNPAPTAHIIKNWLQET